MRRERHIVNKCYGQQLFTKRRRLCDEKSFENVTVFKYYETDGKKWKCYS